MKIILQNNKVLYDYNLLEIVNYSFFIRIFTII